MANLHAMFRKCGTPDNSRTYKTRQKMVASLYGRFQEFKERFDTLAMQAAHDEYDENLEDWDSFFSETTGEKELQEVYVRLVDLDASEEESRETVWSIEMARWNQNDKCPDLLDLWLRRWEYPGALDGRTESSFAVESGYLSKLQTVYDGQTAAALRQVVRRRGVPDPYPLGLSLKYYYINALIDADKVPFRFMDLPPEMRMVVYRHLLTMQTGPADTFRCFPAILRTCRQINEEATCVLYAGPITCKVGVVPVPNIGPLVTWAVHNDKTDLRCHNHSKFLNIPDAITQYPEFLRKCTTVEIVVALRYKSKHEEKMRRVAQSTNHCLLTLASYLADSHQIKCLRIMWDCNNSLRGADFGAATILYPLRRLRNINIVEVHNRGPYKVPGWISRSFVEDIQSSEPVFNTLKHFWLIQEEVKAHLRLVGMIRPLALGEDFAWDGGDEEDVNFLFFMVCAAISQGFVTQLAEENFQARLGQLQDCLDAINLRSLEKQLAIMRERRAARKAYDRVSDDGKLGEAVSIWTDCVYDEDWMDYADFLDAPKSVLHDPPQAASSGDLAAIEQSAAAEDESDSLYSSSSDSEDSADSNQTTESTSDALDDAVE